MSRLKKPSSPRAAPKDDLIDSLLGDEKEGALLPSQSQTNSDTSPSMSRLSAVRRPPPPPPPPQDDDDEAIFSFESQTGAPLNLANEPSQELEKTLSVVRPHDDVKTRVARISVADQHEKSISKVIDQDSERDAADRRARMEQSIRRRTIDLEAAESVVDADYKDHSSAPTRPIDVSTPEKSEEDALKRLPPQFEKKPDQPQNPVPLQSERAPTKPVTADDEKTVAAAQTPAPATQHNASDNLRPVWQDAKTEVISHMTSGDSPDSDPEGEQFMPTEIRPNSPGARFREQSRQAQPGAAIFSSAEAALRQSENLRVAQKRISDLEGELERVRRENENLRSAGETLRRRMDELQSNAENAEMNTQEAKKIAEEERKVLRGQISSRDREISELKSRIDDAEGRLESNFRKIRVRERDLEHRIEIIKAESQSIAASKDRMILELKRQIDQISSELNHAKTQVQETFGQFKERQETARRAVRALRIALTVLEGEEDSGSRKAD